MSDVVRFFSVGEEFVDPSTLSGDVGFSFVGEELVGVRVSFDGLSEQPASVIIDVVPSICRNDRRCTHRACF